ncbi:MAG: hypothetical protein K5929_04510 [Lachnospiraceae bacterium]|nr:hypothetical protein [Lachnospiraceae bacterium]
MDDIFGKVVSLFLAVCVMFGMPFIYMTERAKSARQVYILSEVTCFVDNVCNIGFIDRDMMQKLYMNLSFSDGITMIDILHESDEFVAEDGDGYTDGEVKAYSRVNTFRDEYDIWDVVENDEKYRFLKGDYLKVTVREENTFSMFPFIEDNTVSAVYGGCVKYETD